jgi:Mrp family chromosome partitioning ATPase
VLGIIPHIDPRETMQRLIERRPGLAQVDAEALQSHALLITHFDPKSPVAEAYRTLRTHIQFARQDRGGGKVLVVTSPTLQEGKTTTIVNLALTMAQSGQKTLLVGGNMRRPSIYRFFGIEREPGLSDILVGNARWRDCIRTVADILMGRFEMEDIMAAPGLDNLHIIEAGPIPANPSELLSTEAMTTFLREVSAEYDIVLIDTPPVLPVTDSAIVAGKADGVLLVYQAGKVGRLVLKRAKAHLESTRAKVWGVVLNDVQTEVSGYTYTHYYTHYYGEETPSPREGGSLQRAWNAVRSRVGGPPTSAPMPTAVREPEPESVEAIIAASRSEGRGRRGGSRHWLLGIVILAGLLALFAGVAAWQMGALGSAQKPLTTLRERLGIGTTAPTPPPVKPTLPAGAAKPTTAVTPPPANVTPPPAKAATTVPPAPEPAKAATPVPPAAPAKVATATPPAEPAPAKAAMPAPAAPAPAAKTPSAPTPPAPAPAKAATPAPAPAGPAKVATPTPAPAAPASAKVAPPAPAPAAPVATPPAPRTVASVMTPPAPAAKSPASSTPAATSPAPVTTAPAAATPAAPAKPATTAAATPATGTPRFAVEFGPFKSAPDAERVERQLIQAGFQTVRLRQHAGAALYAVLLERIPGAAEAQTLVGTLREQGYGEAVVLRQDPPVVRVNEPLPLRRAVELGERLRAAGHQVRVAAQPGEASFTIRHGSFASKPEAEARAEELGRLGLASQVIQVR